LDFGLPCPGWTVKPWGGLVVSSKSRSSLLQFFRILHRFFPHFLGLLLLLLSLGSTTCCWCSSHWVGSSISIRIRQELLDIFDLLTHRNWPNWYQKWPYSNWNHLFQGTSFWGIQPFVFRECFWEVSLPFQRQKWPKSSWFLSMFCFGNQEKANFQVPVA